MHRDWPGLAALRAGAEELYDLDSDPCERRLLGGSPLQARLAAFLDEAMERGLGPQD